MTENRHPGRFLVTPAAAPAAMGRGPVSLLAAALLVSSCALGPDYQRPEVELPKDFGVAQSQAKAPERWWALFQDPVLDQLVDEALAANRDLRAAAERIEQARAQLGISRADLWPSAGVEFSKERTKQSELGSFEQPPGTPLQTTNHRLVLRAAWELDFWGKFRRATEAARSELVASEAGRDAVRASLIADVTRGYFALRALDRRLEQLERELGGRVKALELQKLRFDSGVVSELEYRQVESDLRGTQALIPGVRQQLLAQEGALAVLLGRSPRAVFEAKVERGQPTTPVVEVPAGLPSDLLLRRPDLRQAEARLQAANARIGVARAAYFPAISLTGFFGGESQSLGDLFKGAARTWSLVGDVLQPIVASERLHGGVDLANARTREAAELYQKAIALAFREVRDAIAAQTNLRDAHVAQLERARALSRTAELARLRYDNGAVSLFEVLEAERQLIVARLEAIDAERDRTNAIVDLYIALGA